SSPFGSVLVSSALPASQGFGWRHDGRLLNINEIPQFAWREGAALNERNEHVDLTRRDA
ncbi:MAG: hypothetical protein ACI9NC_005203, partial [Verrucomicrobiales bacterium]